MGSADQGVFWRCYESVVFNADPPRKPHRRRRRGRQTTLRLAKVDFKWSNEHYHIQGSTLAIVTPKLPTSAAVSPVAAIKSLEQLELLVRLL
jgi:hypothetical protein